MPLRFEGCRERLRLAKVHRENIAVLWNKAGKAEELYDVVVGFPHGLPIVSLLFGQFMPRTSKIFMLRHRRVSPKLYRRTSFFCTSATRSVTIQPVESRLI
jgi:hypothetical protein